MTQIHNHHQQRRRRTSSMTLCSFFVMLSMASIDTASCFSSPTTTSSSRVLSPFPWTPSSSSSSSTTTSSTRLSSSVRYPHHASSSSSSEDEMSQMRLEIEQLREEAQRRLEALNEMMHQNENGNPEETSNQEQEHAVLQAQEEYEQQQKQHHQHQQLKVMPPRMELADEARMEREEEAKLWDARYKNDRRSMQTKQDPSSRMELMDEARMERDEEEKLWNARYESDRKFRNKAETTATRASTTPATTATNNAEVLLDDTRWRLMLNIGREPGTWMPKTWGVSGERLLMNLELEFAAAPVVGYGDEFLNGQDQVHQLVVIHNEASIAPNLREGALRGLRVANGAWRVAPGEGPMGTSVLRFYFELQQEVRHQGSDVYCPAGRIYCTCGYFNMADRIQIKDRIRKEQAHLNAQYQKLVQDDQDDKSLMSLGKMKRAKQMMDMRVAANKLVQKMNVAQVQEPDKSLLRLSQDQRVGLTREGGVCCKVQKGLAMEYHILGKFEIASMHNREHSDYRELLP